MYVQTCVSDCASLIVSNIHIDRNYYWLTIDLVPVCGCLCDCFKHHSLMREKEKGDQRDDGTEVIGETEQSQRHLLSNQRHHDRK